VPVAACSESAVRPLPRHLRGAVSPWTSLVVPNHHIHPPTIHSLSLLCIAEFALAERMYKRQSTDQSAV
jgi:hypothetical protein